jgi:NAD(P)-dependent dehydrogenase (short-subunit alcohol dehydrogenase family)
MKQTVLITGASSGFGKVFATRFAAGGWNVIATMRTPPSMPPDHPDILVTALDVQDRASIDRAVAAGIDRFGAIDAVINNAGFGLFGVFEETPRERIEVELGVNLLGAMDVTRAVLPHMRARRRGIVANISSGAGVFALPMASMYCASKFALEGFSEGLAYELSPLGIVVKIIEPGGVLATGFGERSAREAAAATPIPDYAPFREHAAGVFAGLRAARGLATSEEVAEVTFTAVTDGTRRLRYVATADIQPLVKARRETSEEQYITLMRSQFERGEGTRS